MPGARHPSGSAVLLALALGATPAFAQAWLGDFATRRPVTVGSTVGLSDFQVALTVDTTGARTGCPDLRVTASDGVTLLPIWVESGCLSANTTVWVRAPALPATLFVYQGSASAADVSSATAVHLFFDDFALNPNLNGKWLDIYRDLPDPGGEFVYDAGTLHLTETREDLGGGATMLMIDPAWENGFEVAFRFRISGFSRADGGGPGGDGFALGFFHEGNAGSGGTFALARNGYAVEFDTFKNPVVDPSANHIAIVRTVPDSSGDPPYVHLAYTDTALLRDLAWHQARVQVLSNSATVWVDGTQIVTVNQAWVKTNRRLLFGGGTGTDFAAHALADVRVRRSAAVDPTVQVGATQVQPATDGGPLAPGSLTVAPNPSSGLVQLSWPAAGGATGYTLDREGGATALVLGSTANTRFADAPPGGRWRFGVKSTNAVGASAYTYSEEVVIDDVPPTAPGTPTVTTDPLRAQTQVAWAAAEDPGGTGVELYELQASTDSATWTSQPLTSSTEVIFLGPTGQYAFRVRARDRVGNLGAFSPASEPVQVNQNDPPERKFGVGCQATPASVGLAALAVLLLAWRRSRPQRR